MKFRSTMLMLAGFCGLAVAVTESSARQEPAPPPPPTGRIANVDQSAQQAHPVARRAKSVLGTKVSLQGNVSIGTVDDIVFSDDGYVEYLLVINEGKLVAVPWEAAKFNFEQRTAIVNIPETRFREIPTFTVQTYPNFYEPTYRTQIYKYYGLTPRLAERRADAIDRRQDRRDDRRDRPPQ